MTWPKWWARRRLAHWRSRVVSAGKREDEPCTCSPYFPVRHHLPDCTHFESTEERMTWPKWWARRRLEYWRGRVVSARKRLLASIDAQDRFMEDAEERRLTVALGKVQTWRRRL